jgi:hypothetical protein
MTGPVFKAAVLGLLLAASRGGAQTRQFDRNDAIAAAPDAAYIFYRTRYRAELRFARQVSPEDRIAWQRARAEALVEARRDQARAAARWDAEDRRCRGNPELTCQNRPRRPVEPTEDNFAYAPPEASGVFAVSRGPQFSAEDGRYTNLVRVEPGTYLIYGQINQGAVGEEGVCLCMGTVSFAAPAGQVVDLGEIRFPRLEARQEERRFGASRLSSIEVVPPAPNAALPPRLVAMPRVAADYRAAGPIPNFYFGVEIDRLPAMAGVLAYERDRIIDLRARDGTR